MQARIKRRLTLALHAWAQGSLVRSDQVKHNYSKLEGYHVRFGSDIGRIRLLLIRLLVCSILGSTMLLSRILL